MSDHLFVLRSCEIEITGLRFSSVIQTWTNLKEGYSQEKVKYSVEIKHAHRRGDNREVCNNYLLQKKVWLDQMTGGDVTLHFLTPPAPRIG